MESCIAVGMDEVPPCTPGDVYVLVYKKIEALSPVEVLAEQQAHADARRRRHIKTRERKNIINNKEKRD